MRQEEKVSSSSFFVTLTYDTTTVPISDHGFMTLDKRDFQLFMKRLRKLSKNKLRYYAVGEYGSERMRPHYHMILFNLEDVEFLNDAWQKGDIHVGRVSGASIAYTVKYIDKEKRIPIHARDDRLKEFSLMSKGIGANYMSDAIKRYHKSRLNVNYVVDTDGHKIAMPRYYRDKMFTDDERRELRRYVVKELTETNLEKDRVLILKNGPGYDLDRHKELEKEARWRSFYKRQ
jgi:hypothetical protein